MVSIPIEQATVMFFAPGTCELRRTWPSPLTWDQARRLRGARPADPPPRPSAERVTAQRVASNIGVIMVAGQKIALGRIHARRIVTVHVAAPDRGDQLFTLWKLFPTPVHLPCCVVAGQMVK